MSRRLEELGAEVAKVQDETLADDARRAAVRRRLVSPESGAAPKARSPRWAPALAWAGAMAAIALAVVALWPSVPEPLAYRVEGETESKLLDREIEAPSDGARSIAFTDGSAVRLSPSARARIRQLRTDGATLALDRGEATVSVRHRRQTRWSVEAGPFLVRVIGTRFRVGWQPEAESFELEVFEGEVRVRGPGVPERVVRRGDEVRETLAAQVEPEVAPEPAPPPREDPATPSKPAPRKQTAPIAPQRPSGEGPPARNPSPRSSTAPRAAPFELKLPPKEPDTYVVPDDAEPAPETESQEPVRPDGPEVSKKPAPAEPPSATPPSWKTLLDEGDYRALLTELRPDEVEQALWQADATQLIDLGAEARELGDTRAGSIYTVVRSRFPGTEAAADAAFLLGRMQFHSGAYRTSATWFETYLRERPDGRLAREAAGRLVESYHRSGDRDEAREAAEQYLRRYPDGPHAALARSVLK